MATMFDGDKKLQLLEQQQLYLKSIPIKKRKRMSQGFFFNVKHVIHSFYDHRDTPCTS